MRWLGSASDTEFFPDFGDVGFVYSIDEVVEDHVKPEYSLYHFVDSYLLGDMLKYHPVHGGHGSRTIASVPAMEEKRSFPIADNTHRCNQIFQTQQGGPGTEMMQRE